MSEHYSEKNGKVKLNAASGCAGARPGALWNGALSCNLTSYNPSVPFHCFRAKPLASQTDKNALSL
jgi:hypothetical protein